MSEIKEWWLQTPEEGTTLINKLIQETNILKEEQRALELKAENKKKEITNIIKSKWYANPDKFNTDLVDIQNTSVIKLEKRYDEVWFFSEWLAGVEKDGKYWFIDKTWKEVTPCKYDEIYDFEEWFAAVNKNGKWGFINTKWEEVTPCEYDEVRNFSKWFAVVEKNGKYWFINRDGTLIINLVYNAPFIEKIDEKLHITWYDKVGNKLDNYILDIPADLSLSDEE